MTERPKLESIKAALEEVGAAGEAARLQLHLLSMQARDRTEELAASIEALEHRVDKGLEMAVAAAADKSRKLSNALCELLGAENAPSGAPPCVGAIMTRDPAWASPDDSLNTAARRMWDLDCGALPVVRGEALVGMLTDRDICMAAYTKGTALDAIRVEEIMAKHVVAGSAEDSLTRAVAIMAEAQVRRLPVVGEGRRLLGIVSLSDIARAASVLGASQAATLVYELERSISQRRHRPPDEQRWAAQ